MFRKRKACRRNCSATQFKNPCVTDKDKFTKHAGKQGALLQTLQICQFKSSHWLVTDNIYLPIFSGFLFQTYIFKIYYIRQNDLQSQHRVTATILISKQAQLHCECWWDLVNRLYSWIYQTHNKTVFTMRPSYQTDTTHCGLERLNC